MVQIVQENDISFGNLKLCRRLSHINPRKPDIFKNSNEWGKYLYYVLKLSYIMYFCKLICIFNIMIILMRFGKIS